VLETLVARADVGPNAKHNILEVFHARSF
jgi:hypothetical protein